MSDNNDIMAEVDKALHALNLRFGAAAVLALVAICVAIYTVKSSERWAYSQTEEFFRAEVWQTYEGILMAREFGPLAVSMATRDDSIRRYYVPLIGGRSYVFNIDMENNVLYTHEELESLLSKNESGEYSYNIDQLKQKLRQDTVDKIDFWI